MNRAIYSAMLLGLGGSTPPPYRLDVKPLEPGFLQPEPKRDKPEWMKKARDRQRRKKGRK